MPPYNSIRAVLFDLDGTLRFSRPGGFETLIGWLAELGHQLSDEQRQRGERWTHYYWAVAPERREDEAAHGADTPTFWRHYSERHLRVLEVVGDLPALAAELHRRFETEYQPAHHVPDDVRPTLARLRAAGLALGLVSNRTEPLEPLAGELGLIGDFDFCLSAGQAQSYKPDPGIFLQAVARAGCAPAEAAYIGDNYYADIEGARRAGLHPVLVDPRGVFPDPGCPVVSAIGELEPVLARLAA